MAEFAIGVEVKTDVPTVEVTVSPDNPLRVGRQTFRLVVVDDSGNSSIPDEIQIIVADQDAPTAVLKGPTVVAAGRSFGLDGSASFDVGGGKVVTYLWTYVGPTNT
jgi:hypothetical protein